MNSIASKTQLLRAALCAVALLAACGDDDSAPESSDAGGDSAPACDDRACLCEMACQNIVAADCSADLPLSDCIAECEPTPDDCEAENTALQRCQAERPESAFSCDPQFDGYVVTGCNAEQEALTDCLFM